MKRDEIAQQAHLVDLDDKSLLDFIGFLFDEIKNIEERIRCDEHIEKLENELREYKAMKYTDTQKAYKARLKAARALAKVRGLKFNVPELN